MIFHRYLISSLRAFRRARDGAAKGGGSWEKIRWPDAKFEVTSAKCDLGNEQQREKREESRERSEKREERREKREEGDKPDRDERVEGRNGSVPEWLDGTEKGRSLRGRKAERTAMRPREDRRRARYGDAGMVRTQGW